MAHICAIKAVLKRVECFYRAGTKSFSHRHAADLHISIYYVLFDNLPSSSPLSTFSLLLSLHGAVTG